jgi:hypothetical protein
MFAFFDEDLGYAIEELEKIIDFLKIAQLLADDDAVPDLPLADRKRYMALMAQQAILHNDTALDFFKLWPERLEKQP